MQKFIKEFFKGTLIGTAIYVVFMVYFYFFTDVDKTQLWRGAWAEYYENIIFSVIIYMLNIYWFDYILKRFDKKIWGIKRFSIAFGGNIVVSLIAIFFARLIRLVFFGDEVFMEFLLGERVHNYTQSLIISIVINVIFYGAYYYKYRQDNKVKEQKIIAGTASARFDALKNQLDPHFLFNSLNVLTSLIEEDPYQAQKFTTSLSKVYRYVLEQKNKDLVTVDEELNFARTYVRLLKMRFEDSIVFDIPDQATDPDAKIVPLSLQLLLENAVKHNVVTASRPLHLKVFEAGNNLVVSNNLQAKEVVKKSSGVGLQNIKQRYQILTDREVSIEKTETDFRVTLPMLNQQISRVETQDEFLEEKRYEKARERVEAIKGFYGNLTAYVFVIPFLWWINYRTTSFTWAIFPTLGWGFGLAAHALQAFGYHPLLGKDWEERKIRQFMEDEDF